MPKPRCTARYLTDLEEEGYTSCFKAKGHKGGHVSLKGNRWSDDHPRHAYATIVSGAPDQPESAEMLAQENEALREDAEDYNNRIEDLKGQVERLIQEVAQEKARQDAYESGLIFELNEAVTNLTEYKEGLEQRVKDLEALIASMRLNGARHHFVFAYDRHMEEAGRRLQFCRDCDKEKEHPAHFAQGSRYLDSREVEKAARAAQERLCNLLVDGMKLGHMTALNTARELLQGLPGIGDFQAVPGRPEVRG